jgi:hypothetical protein
VATSYRSLAKVERNERWVIPGFLMGGEALPMPKGFHLDEVMLIGTYGEGDSYAYVKAGQHAGADELSVVYHAGLEIGQLARRLSRAEKSGRGGSPDDGDGTRTEEEPNCGLDLHGSKDADGLACSTQAMTKYQTGTRIYMTYSTAVLRDE